MIRYAQKRGQAIDRAVVRAWIAGTGSYLPARVVTNDEICSHAPTTDEWIRTKLGIETRRMAAPGEQASDLACVAASRALEGSGVQRSQLDGILCSVTIGDVPLPATAGYIQHKLQINTKCFAFDIKLACAGAIGGVMLARGLIESGMARNILVVGTQIISRTTLDRTDRVTAGLFGDGAGALILSVAPDPKSGVLASRLYTDGSLTEVVGQYVGGTREWYSPEAIEQKRLSVTMDGRAVWDCAARELPKVIREVLGACSATLDDVDFVVAHQANKILLAHVMEQVGLPMSKTYTNIEKYGNTANASAFIALDEAVRLGHIKRGDLIVFLAIGAGMTWGAHLIRW